MKATAVDDNAKAEALADQHDKKFQIFINTVGYKVTQATMTGAELKELASIPAANQIFQDSAGNHDDPQILDDVPISLKSGMKFYDVPVGNFGAR